MAKFQLALRYIPYTFFVLFFLVGIPQFDAVVTASPAFHGQLMLVDVTVIDVRNGKAIPHRNVLIEGKMILAIGDSASQ